ncbi:MAG TPA: metallophosphoesterase family protein [Thermoflexia bacterium]|nr:metallophosphoesterase family protein [Thermoflexia bacterium]
MRIGLLADTHNRLDKVALAVERLRGEGLQSVLHAGDVTGPQVLQELRDFDLWIARGNMDRNPLLGTVAEELFGHDRFRDVHTLTLAGQHIALLHGDQHRLLKLLVDSGSYDYVIHGHTHTFRDEHQAHTRIINPGALSNTSWRPGAFAILDLQTGKLERLTV